jgi:hypothetical protein
MGTQRLSSVKQQTMATGTLNANEILSATDDAVSELAGLMSAVDDDKVNSYSL